MPFLVRENLFIGNISDAVEILENGSSEFTHMLSVVSSSSISFFTEWRSSLVIPVKEIQQEFAGFPKSGGEGCWSKSALSPDKPVYNLEYAGKELKVMRMAVALKDTEDENLLDYLELCLDFVDESRKQGCVLVHCFAGVSRRVKQTLQNFEGTSVSSRRPVHSSASFNVTGFSMAVPSTQSICFAAIVTAYLMRSEQLSLEDALESLRQSCESVSPNDNFLEQLKMFEEMGFKVDRGSSKYKRFRLKMLGDSYNRGERLDSSKFGVDPGLPQEVASNKSHVSLDGHSNTNVAYRCKKCRRVVALQENIVDHVPGEGMTAFQWHKRNAGNLSNRPDEFGCTSIFVEPLKWMKTVEEGGIEGKLSCAHCDARLGYFNWSGSQCNCGSWITPAFQLHKSRMDLSTV